LSPSPALAVKTDVVVVRNGDSLTGEVKGLQRGLLSFKTSATDRINVKWDEVVSLKSTQYLEVELSNGIRAYGTIAPDTTRGRMQVLGPRTTWAFEYANVVSITPIKKSFFSRVDGSISLGVSYTQATNIFQLNFAFNAAYRVRRYQFNVGAGSNITVQDSTTRRQEVDLNYKRFLPKKFMAGGALSLQENREQGFNLRALFTGGGGYSLIKQNDRLFTFFGGLTLNVEEPVQGDATQSLEAILSTNYQTYTYHDPERDLTATLSVFPSLTQGGRWRVQLNINTQWEIVNNFAFMLDLLETYDTDPPTEGANENDLTLTSSLGYTF
jgi:putative salt-induced outer membrane protein YdiY